jgi:hypothetical protein
MECLPSVQPLPSPVTKELSVCGDQRSKPYYTTLPLLSPHHLPHRPLLLVSTGLCNTESLQATLDQISSNSLARLAGVTRSGVANT